MSDRDDFLAWVKSTLREAEAALHNGDTGPRRLIWSRNEPVSILGALRNSYGLQQVDESFTWLEQMFSDCQSYDFELQAFDVVGDMAYTAGMEYISTSWMVSHELSRCRPRRCTVAKTVSGKWPIATPTR